MGGIPQGDYAPVPWLLSSRGYALWLETWGTGACSTSASTSRASRPRAPPGRYALHVFTDPSPAARLRRYLRETGLPALLPEWAYGYWKSRDVYEHQRRRRGRLRGLPRPRVPLDALVLDSPWETQYNTWEPNPHQFPDFAGMVRALRDDGVRTVVWVTPWVNLDSKRRAEAARPRVRAAALRAGLELRGGRRRGPLRARPQRRACGALVDGHGSPVDFTSPDAEDVVAGAGAQRPRPRRGGHQGRRRRGLLHPGRGPLLRRPHRRRGGVGAGRPLQGVDAAGARRGPPRPRRALRPQRLERPAGVGHAVGRRPGVGLLVAAHARGGELTAARAASRTGRTTWAATWPQAVERCPPSCSCAGPSSAASRR